MCCMLYVLYATHLYYRTIINAAGTLKVRKELQHHCTVHVWSWRISSSGIFINKNCQNTLNSANSSSEAQTEQIWCENKQKCSVNTGSLNKVATVLKGNQVFTWSNLHHFIVDTECAYTRKSMNVYAYFFSYADICWQWHQCYCHESQWMKLHPVVLNGIDNEQ